MRYTALPLKILLGSMFLGLTILPAYAGSRAISEVVNDPQDLRLTWTRGRLYVPGSATLDGKPCVGSIEVGKHSCHQKINQNRKHPAVVYLHGCTGAMEAQNTGEFIITFAPNSFARPSRAKAGYRGCWADDSKSVTLLRIAEARYAAKKLRTLNWIDPTKLYLVGFSEGGRATALYNGDEYAGRVILGWPCHANDEWYRGIRGSRKVPVLAVIGTKDRHHQTSDRVGRHCGEKFGDRLHSQSIQLEGVGHDVHRLPEVEKMIKAFILSFDKKHFKKTE